MRREPGVGLATPILLFVAMAIGAPTGTHAQSGCSAYELNSVLVNIRRDPSIPGGYIDVLEKGDIACVTKKRQIAKISWAFVKSKTDQGGGRADVGGWANLQYLEPTAGSQSKQASLKEEPLAIEPPAKVALKPAPGKAAKHKSTAKGDDTFRFDQPVPFGPYPVRGKTLKELAEWKPMFSPIKDLDEGLWKKKCTTCHKWNQKRLCGQGKSYLKAARFVLRHQHPYGGPYKLALMRWAKTGCQ